jgi:hypothetical protein
LPTSACSSTLPSACTALSSLTSIAAIAQAPLCAASLGVYNVGNVANCFVNLVSNVLGSSILNCVQLNLGAVCINQLPQQCLNLAVDTTVASLEVSLPLCTIALGPLASGTVLECLSTSLGTGAAVINCLTNRLFG